MRPEIDRLRNDLATMRAATGLAPAWNEHAIRTHLLLAAAGAVAALWAVLPHGLWEIAGLAAFIVPVVDWWWQARGRANRSASDDREWREGLMVFWYVLPLGVLAWWSRAVGLELVTMAGLMCFMLGFVLFGSAVSARGARPLLGWALAFMIGGLLIPMRMDAIVPILGLAICAGALTSAGWIAVDVRRAKAA
jgi:diacylglycerol kinase